jgi:HK97 family phage prohead protease
MEHEKRVLAIKDLKVEKRTAGETLPKITGYAAVFDSLSEDLGGFREKIAPGAFKKAIKRSDARALVNHDSNLLLGRQSSGTLRLKEDSTGLHMEIDPPDTSYARDLITLIERGDIREQSFGFTVKTETWEDIDKREPIRTLVEIDRLYDVSPVAYPAYPETSVALRSLEEAKKTEPEAIPENKSEITDADIIGRFFELFKKSLIGKPMQPEKTDTEPEPTQGRKIEDWSEVDDRLKKYNQENKL